MNIIIMAVYITIFVHYLGQKSKEFYGLHCPSQRPGQLMTEVSGSVLVEYHCIIMAHILYIIVC